MKLVIKARKMKLTPSIKQYLHGKLVEPTLRIFDSPAAKLEVEVCDGPHSKQCSIHYRMPRCSPINITEQAENLYEAIDSSHDRLLLQIKRNRQQHRSVARRRTSPWRSRSGHAHAAQPANAALLQ